MHLGWTLNRAIGLTGEPVIWQVPRCRDCIVRATCYARRLQEVLED